MIQWSAAFLDGSEETIMQEVGPHFLARRQCTIDYLDSNHELPRAIRVVYGIVYARAVSAVRQGLAEQDP